MVEIKTYILLAGNKTEFSIQYAILSKNYLFIKMSLKTESFITILVIRASEFILSKFMFS